MTGWVPGSYSQRVELEEPYEGVPAHLRAKLARLILEPLSQQPNWLTVVLNRHRVPLQMDPDAGHHGLRHGLEQLQAHIDDEQNLLNVLESVMLMPSFTPYMQELANALAIGNSAYELRDDKKGLQLRVDPAVRDQLRATISEATGTSMADHLTNSWNAAYGRQNDPVKSYSEAIKAVEAASIPLVSPNHAKATLGTVRGELKANASRYKFSIQGQGDDSIDRVTGVISLLWDGQTSRHGGASPTVPETIDAARAAVHIAGTLCQWFISGAVSRR